VGTKPVPVRNQAPAEQGYDLSLNRYKETVHDDGEHRPPLEIIADIERIEVEIQEAVAELKAMLS
jgi:type I restriction enzyme M protein